MTLTYLNLRPGDIVMLGTPRGLVLARWETPIGAPPGFFTARGERLSAGIRRRATLAEVRAFNVAEGNVCRCRGVGAIAHGDPRDPESIEICECGGAL